MKFSNIIQRINFFSILLLALFLPFSKQWISYFIAFWALTWILDGNFNLKSKKWINWKLWLPISILLLNLISIIFSSDKEISFFLVQTQISLLLIPLILVSVNSNFREKMNEIFVAYIIGVFLLSVYLFYNIVYLNQELYFNSEMNLNNLLEIADKFSYGNGHRSYLSLHLSLGIILVIHMIEAKKREYYIRLLISSLIIIFFATILILNSRAALITIIFLTFYFLIKFLKNAKFWFRSLIFLLVFIGFGYLIIQSRLSPNVNWFTQKIFENNEAGNLYSNGDFKYGVKDWGAIAPDSISYELLETENGKALRIKRKVGEGWWSLAYKGREIYYHKDLTYKIHFKLKVIKGDDIPFCVGWWVNEQGAYKNDLKITVVNLENGWFDCSAEYTFVEDHQDLVSFINSQLPNTVFDITDIELTCNDSLNRLMFVDQKEDIRFSLWKNAFIVWTEKPLFGHGIGDTQEAIVKVHQDRNITDAIESKLNAHNQFLETAMQTGLVGLIVLLLVFAIPLYQSIKKKQELLFLFLMICFINFLFESMLQRLAGVVFFAFWYSFLWFVYYKDENEKEFS